MSMTGGAGSPDTIIGDLATNHPRVVPVLERLGLDCCCGGARPIGDAVAEAGLDRPSVAAQIDAALSSSAEAHDSPSWAEASPSVLMAHIVDRSHAKLREDLPALTTMGQRVVGAHGERHGEVREVLSVLTALRTELDAHMMKEEHRLCPCIEQIETGLGHRHPMVGHMASPLAFMVHEHESAGTALARVRTLTSAYAAPEDPCTTLREYYGGLAGLERELHEHIHLENHLRFPRAQQLEIQALKRF